MVDELAGGDLLKWESIFKMPYEVVMTKKLYNVTRANFEARYLEIMKERQASKQKRLRYR